MVKNQCLLCQADAQPKSKWSSVIDNQVAKSLTRLLEEQSDNFLEFFCRAEYCDPCQEFVLEIDFLMHGLSSIQSKINKYRTKLSHLLLENGNLWNESKFQEEECSEIDVKILEADDLYDTIETSSTPSLGPEVDMHMPQLIEPEEHSPDSDKLSTEASGTEVFKLDSSEIISVVPVEIPPNPTELPNDCEISAELTSNTIPSKDCPAKRKPRKRKEKLAEKPEVLVTVILSSSDDLVPVRRQNRSRASTNKLSVSYKEIQSGSECDPGSGAESSDILQDRDAEFVVNPSEDSDSDSFEKSAQQPDKPLGLVDSGNRNQTSKQKRSYTRKRKISIPRDSQQEECKMPKIRRTRKYPVPRYKFPKKFRPTIDPRPDGRFECYRENCTKNYLTARDLRRHIFEKHPDRTAEEDEKLIPTRYRHPCKEPGCSYFSRSEGQLKIHVQKEHLNNPRPFKCNLCSKDYPSVNSLRLHEGNIHKSDCVCDICGEVYGCRSRLQHHFKVKHNDVERFRCTICNKKLLFEDDLKSHEERHAGSGRDKWTCVVISCYLQFDNQEALKQHVVDEHDTVKKLICEVCGMKYIRKKDFEYHLLSHAAGPLPFKCLNCEKRYKSDYHRKTHMEIAHGAANGQVYPCKLCEKTFHCRAYLHKHTAWHKHGVNANKPKAKQVRNSDLESD